MIPIALQPFANHLWQSTIFAVFAALLTPALRKNRAQIRYWLWFTASLKFLLPFSILIAVGKQFGHHTVAAIAPSDFSFVMERVSAPFAESFPVTTLPTAPSSPVSWIPAILCGLWAIGFMVVTYSWWLRWRSVRAALRTASPLDLSIHLKVLTSPEFREPGVFGIHHPILLLPEGITRHLTPLQLEAILKHEVCHVRRQDNLTTAIHMLVEALFWFHPLVWWLGARLVEERELACDEEVLRMGSEPQAYAEGILRICELYLESPLPCVAGVTGGKLKKRIEAIMTNQAVLQLSFARKVILAMAGLAAVTIPVGIGIVNAPAMSAQTATATMPQWQIAAGGRMAFEVASIRQRAPGAQFTPPNFPLSNENAYADTGGRFIANFPLVVYITFAYKLELTREQRQAMVAHLPNWVSNDSFIIQAKAANHNPTKDQMRLMMQSLLADRFQLALHFETRETAVLAMTLVRPGKPGPKLIPHADGPPCDGPPDPNLFPSQCEVTSLERNSSGSIGGSRNTTLEMIASALPSLGRLSRPVVDRTGLSGNFDYRLEWTPEPNGASPPGLNTQPDLQGTTFLQAVRDQLGIKLESTKASIQTIVIDRVEHPLEN